MVDMYAELYKRLKSHVSEDMMIALGDCKQDVGLCAKLRITTVPYVMVFKGDQVLEDEAYTGTNIIFLARVISWNTCYILIICTVYCRVFVTP